MKNKLSVYWFCQIGGWGAYTLFWTIGYSSLPGFSFWSTGFPTILEAITGICVTHFMRLFILKIGILQQKITRQIFYLFLVTFAFAFISATISYCILLIVSHLWKSLVIITKPYGPGNLIAIIYSNIFFGIWNLIYFSYHYVRKSQQEQIERIGFESKLKIQQLESEKSQIEYQRNLGNHYLMALRYRMNPHFIFNCLNSIKLYTIQNDTTSATDYLTKFSKLIRLVMENSSKAKILLSSEIDMLRLYIDMEAMRFKEKLQYAIHIDKEVEAEYIELPPLLLQPYVENAIWHGLMPKEEGGKIDIDITMMGNEFLQISIADDGIGRIKSSAIKKETALKHNSNGMQVTSDRIALINQVYKTGAEVKIEDLFDSDGNTAGTKVIIQIPIL